MYSRIVGVFKRTTNFNRHVKKASGFSSRPTGSISEEILVLFPSSFEIPPPSSVEVAEMAMTIEGTIFFSVFLSYEKYLSHDSPLPAPAIVRQSRRYSPPRNPLSAALESCKSWFLIVLDASRSNWIEFLHVTQIAFEPSTRKGASKRIL